MRKNANNRMKNSENNATPIRANGSKSTKLRNYSSLFLNNVY